MDSVGTKSGIINIARKLFYSKGFSKTSIQNIINEADIAKGTFYHYFKSKDDLLNQMTERDVEALYNLIYKILDLDIDAIKKLNMVFQTASTWKSENIQMMKVLVKTILSDSNLALRHTMLRQSIKQLTPIYQRIILQGNNEGLFNVTDTDYTANFILASFINNGEEMYKFLTAPKFTEDIILEFKKYIHNYEVTMERLLGAEEGTIHLIDSVVLEKLLKGLLEA